jgi:hypothetical protein
MDKHGKINGIIWENDELSLKKYLIFIFLLKKLIKLCVNPKFKI